jgi:hypothetical protein
MKRTMERLMKRKKVREMEKEWRIMRKLKLVPNHRRVVIVERPSIRMMVSDKLIIIQ